jgi:hypothetical protein
VIKEANTALRGAETDIRKLYSLLARFMDAGGRVNPAAFGGIAGPGVGGSGVAGNALSATIWQNTSGGTLTQGSVVQKNGNRTMTTTTTVSDLDVIGVVEARADTGALSVENNEDAIVRHNGYQAVVLVQNAVAVGDYLRASATAARAESAGVTPVAGIFGVALTAKVGAGAGSVAAFLFPVLLAAGSAHDILSVTHSDVDETDTPADGDVLTWDNVAGKWIASPPAAGGSGSGPVWVQPHSGDGVYTIAAVKGDHGAAILGSATDDGTAHMTLPVPENFDTLTRLVAIVIAPSTHNLRYSVATDYGADGEDYNANTGSIAATTRAMTANKFDEIDLSAAVTLAGRDYVGIAFTRLGSDVLDTLVGDFVLLGVLMEYTATGVMDASAITYTPAVLTDWDGDADPGELDDALDQLAERVDDLEGAGGVTYGSTPSQIDVGDAQAGGADATVSRNDHQHALPAPAAPANVTKAAAAAGAATTVARADHKHDATTAVPTDSTPGDTAAEGGASSLARSDHLHGREAGGGGTGGSSTLKDVLVLNRGHFGIAGPRANAIGATGATVYDGLWGQGSVAAGTAQAIEDAGGFGVQYRTSSGSGQVGVVATTPGDGNHTRRHNPAFLIKFRHTPTTTVRFFCGVSNTSAVNMTGGDSPAFSYAGIRYSTVAGDTTYRFVSKDGTTLENTDSGIGVNTNVQYLRITFDDSVPNVLIELLDATFAVVASVTHATNLPAQSAQLSFVLSATNQAIQTLDVVLYYAHGVNQL